MLDSMHNLDADRRRALEMSFFEGLGHDEIAKRLCVTPQGVTALLDEGLNHLRQALLTYAREQTATLSCKACGDLMFLYLMDAIGPGQRNELHAHLETGCPFCTGHMAEAEAIIAQLALVPESVKPNTEARLLLMRRVLKKL